MGTNRSNHLYRVASATRGQLTRMICAPENSPGKWSEDMHHHCDAFWHEFGWHVVGNVSKMGSAARGTIVACNHPRFEYWKAIEQGVYHEYTKVTPRNGDELLSLLAARLVSMAIVDQLRAEEERYQQEDARDRHFARGEGSELEEWFNRNPLS